MYLKASICVVDLPEVNCLETDRAVPHALDPGLGGSLTSGSSARESPSGLQRDIMTKDGA